MDSIHHLKYPSVASRGSAIHVFLVIPLFYVVLLVLGLCQLSDTRVQLPVLRN